MKKFIGIVIALVIVDLGATYYVGGMAEQKFIEMEKLLDKNKMISSETITYKRGFFKSSAETQFKFKYAGGEKVAKVEHIILHGPIVIDIHGDNKINFKLAVIKSYPLELSPSIKMPYRGNTSISYNGDITSQYEGDAFEIVKANQYKIMGSGWTSIAYLTKKNTTMNGFINVPSVSVLINGVMVDIKKIELKFDQNLSKIGQWLGSHSLGFDSIEQKEMNVKVQNLKFSDNSNLTGELMNFLWKIDLEKVAFQQQNYGPLHLPIDISNIDPIVFNMMEQRGSEASDKIKQQILSKKPTITIDEASLTLPEGDVKLMLKLQAGGPEITLPIDNAKVVKTINGEVEATLPKEILRKVLSTGLRNELVNDLNYQQMPPDQKGVYLNQQLDAKIQKLITDGLMVDKDTVYDIKITVVNGEYDQGKVPTENPALQVK